MWELRRILDHILDCAGFALGSMHGAEEVEVFTDSDGRICLRLPLQACPSRHEDGRMMVTEANKEMWEAHGRPRIEDDDLPQGAD